MARKIGLARSHTVPNNPEDQPRPTTLEHFSPQVAMLISPLAPTSGVYGYPRTLSCFPLTIQKLEREQVPEPANQPTVARSLTARLRTDRDSWRCRFLQQERRLIAMAGQLKTSKEANKDLRADSNSLLSVLKDAIESGKSLLVRIRNIGVENQDLSHRLSEANRTILQLRKSDRAKGKIEQRNLNLKAHLGRKSTMEQTLIEALNTACDRIGELEAAGNSLMEASDRINDTDGSEDESGGESVMEAELKFRGTLQDQTFSEMKQLWADFLDV